MEHRDNDILHKYLSHLMKERSLSVRELRRNSGVDHATIFKFMNGERKANINHFEKLSRSLHVDITMLMEATGYHTRSKKEEELDEEFHKSIQHLIKQTDDVQEEKFTLDKVNAEIDTYQRYSRTDEGEKAIAQGFRSKLNKLSSRGSYIEKLKWMYLKFQSKQGTAREMTPIGATLLYFIATIDLIQDYLMPIGLVDDAFVMKVISQPLENKGLA